MKLLLHLTLLFSISSRSLFAQPGAPQQSLNHYVEFLSRSASVVNARFEMLQRYHEDLDYYRKKPGSGLRLSSSGPLEEYYYQKAIGSENLGATEKQKLNAGADEIWKLLNELDETGKSLETYVRLQTYQTDNLKQSDQTVLKMRSLFRSFQKQRKTFYNQIQKVYQQYQPYQASDPYLSTEKEMSNAIKAQQTLLDSLPFFMDENTIADWPIGLIERSMLADQKLLADFGKAQARLPYPASDVVGNFKDALVSMQAIKRHALDDHNYAAQQSARHGNDVYLSLLKQFNQDLLATQKSFVNYSPSEKRVLYYPDFSAAASAQPVFPAKLPLGQTPPFQDKVYESFSVKKSASPAPAATIQVLNGHVDFINESLRQMHLMQLLVRNYQSSVAYYRDPAQAAKRANLTYTYDDFKIPVAAYQLLTSAASDIPKTYRAPIYSQAEVLLNILKEMNGLSMELVRYTSEKQYLKDQLKRSDEILDRYATLFSVFDQKKEQLYTDLRRVHESFPNPAAATSWYVSGNALLKTLDDNKDILFGVRAFLQGDITKVPSTEHLEAGARQLIADEYKNMKGLKRYGRSNGLCPYTPYEDLAANSLRFSENARKVKAGAQTGSNNHPYQSFYYFYNGELVYLFNKFVELAHSGLLKAVNQPDLFALQRLNNSKTEPAAVSDSTSADKKLISENNASTQPAVQPADERALPVAVTNVPAKHDTVFIERLRVDTVFVNRDSQQNISRTLEGFAANNMVLLLDVSSSMNSPYKMPLLKRSIKSMLTLLREEDQISIVLYSGKARVVLKPTSGIKASEIARMIDLLKSDGDTDGNEGLRLAYKTANKSYIRGGNNRIVMATDGEFPVSNEVMEMISQNARQDLYLTILTFGRNAHTGQKLRKLSELGLGTYAHVTEESADLQLILEAQAKKAAK
jgi:Mg-chelatase subunit ChlD